MYCYVIHNPVTHRVLQFCGKLRVDYFSSPTQNGPFFLHFRQLNDGDFLAECILLYSSSLSIHSSSLGPKNELLIHHYAVPSTRGALPSPLSMLPSPGSGVLLDGFDSGCTICIASTARPFNQRSSCTFTLSHRHVCASSLVRKPPFRVLKSVLTAKRTDRDRQQRTDRTVIRTHTRTHTHPVRRRPSVV